MHIGVFLLMLVSLLLNSHNLLESFASKTKGKEDDGEHKHDLEKFGLGTVNNYRCQHQADPLKLSHGLSKKAYLCAKRHVEYESKAEKLQECPEAINLERSIFKYGSATESHYISEYPDPIVEKDTKQLVRKVLSKWYNEVENYDLENDSIKDENKPVKNFTTMVWDSLTDIGLGLYISEKKNMFAMFALYGPPISDRDFKEKKVENVFPCHVDPCSCLNVPPEIEEIKEKMDKASSSFSFEPVSLFLYFFLYFNFHFLIRFN